MKKTKIILTMLFFLFANNMFGAITIRYYNKDAKDLILKFVLNGSNTEVKFEASKTASVTIQSSSTKCFLETKCGRIEIKDGDKIEIKDGCIKITN